METLNDILEESARKFGTKDALIIRPGFRTRSWTYRDLNEVVPRLARYFKDTGMKKGDRVLIWGVNRPEYGIAFLAALRLGAILVPLEANYAADFAQKIGERTRASAAIVSSQTLERAKTLGLTLHQMEFLPSRPRMAPSREKRSRRRPPRSGHVVRGRSEGACSTATSFRTRRRDADLPIARDALLSFLRCRTGSSSSAASSAASRGRVGHLSDEPPTRRGPAHLQRTQGLHGPDHAGGREVADAGDRAKR